MATNAGVMRQVQEVVRPLNETLREVTARLDAISGDAAPGDLEGRIREQVRLEVEAARGSRREAKVTFDNRRLKVEPYSGVKSTFKDFAWTLRSFVARESGKLHEAMLAVERREEEVTVAVLEGMGVSQELDGELAFLLQNNTATPSVAKTMLRAAEAKTGLEKWRLLARDAVPRGGAQETLLRLKVAKPSKVSKPEEQQLALAQWDADLEEANSQAESGTALSDSEKAMAMLWMMRKPLEEKAMLKKKEKRESYSYLRGLMENDIHTNSMGVAPSLTSRDAAGRWMVEHIQDEDSGDLEEVMRVCPITGETEVFAINRREWSPAAKKGRWSGPKRNGGLAPGPRGG